MMFAPDYHDGSAPFGRWTITAVHLPAGWRTSQNPKDDIAFLTVAPRRIDGKLTTIQQVTGGYRLGSTGKPDESITITGYPAGGATSPITCTTTVYLTGAFPSFNCRGYVGGTSGTPWIRATPHGPQIVGVIGGLHQGGCVDRTSYSSPLGPDVDREYLRAAAGAPGDVAPAADSDGCN